MSEITPQQIANVLINIPPKIRGYLLAEVSSQMFAAIVYGIQTKQIERKKFIQALEADFAAWKESQADPTLPGFEVGQDIELDSEYWIGKKLRIENFIRDSFHKRILIVASYNRVNYMIIPTWVKSN